MAKHINEKNGFLIFLGCMSLAVSLFSCINAHMHQHSAFTNKTKPVEWTPQLSITSLLADEPAINSQEDLSKLLAKPWYASIDVKTNKVDEIRTLNSCNDYFAVKDRDIRAQQEQENDSLLEFKVICEATRLLSQAKPSLYSNVPTDPLDAQLPTKLPKSLALITSKTEWYRIQSNHNLIRWGDVNSIKRVEKNSAYQSVYYSDAGVQTLSVLGRGDINGDKWEDILVTVKDTVDGGSYFNLRLFVLTEITQGQWQVVE